MFKVQQHQIAYSTSEPDNFIGQLGSTISAQDFTLFTNFNTPLFYECDESSDIEIGIEHLKFFTSFKPEGTEQQTMALFIIPEVIKNENDKRIINKIIDLIESYLVDHKYFINCFLYKDVELPEWEEKIVSIKLPELSFKSKLKLWKDVEEHIQLELGRNGNDELKELFKTVAIELR